MNKITLNVLVLSITAVFAVSAHGHDPKEHMKDAEKPDCAAMKNMDHSKMDMNDPVAMALMKKCMNSSHSKDDGQDGHDQDHKQHHDDANTEDSRTDESPDQ